MEKAIPASRVRDCPSSGAEVVADRARPVPAGGWASLLVRGAEPCPKMVVPRGSPCFGSRGVVGTFGGGDGSCFLLLVAVGGGEPP